MMKSWYVKGAVLVASVFMLMGCATSKLRVETKPYEASKILVLPINDVVQFGAEHEKGSGSGKQMQDEVVKGFEGTAFAAIAMDAKPPVKKKDAVKEAKEVGATYCLQLTLGEFLDAAPMTFRSDELTLDDAYMFNVETDETVWQLDEPIKTIKSNVGGYEGLLDKIANIVSKSICKNAGQ